MTDPSHPISFEEFRRLISQTLQVEEEQVISEASFVKDLYADSIRLVELLLNLEDAGVNIPFEEAWNIKTVGDAYRLYISHAASHSNESLVP
jgi:acyl carrier protein